MLKDILPCLNTVILSYLILSYLNLDTSSQRAILSMPSKEESAMDRGPRLPTIA